MSQPLTIDQLDAAIEDRLVGRPMPSGRRLLGIELERLILHRETLESAPLDFCREFLGELVRRLDAEPIRDGGVLSKMRGARFGISMEPGGQLELDTKPCPNLASLEVIFAEITELIERQLVGTDYGLFAFGHAPVTPVADLGLLPRERYRIMDAEMPKRGALTRNMMRATAGFQLTYDVADREDAGRKLSLLNRLAPVMVAITARTGVASDQTRTQGSRPPIARYLPVESSATAAALSATIVVPSRCSRSRFRRVVAVNRHSCSPR